MFPKATYMYWQKRLNRANSGQSIEDEMKKIRKKHKDYGYRRMTQELRNRWFLVNKNKVRSPSKQLQTVQHIGYS
ncbi:IS3 family transposase (plasmid) [Bacillus sp. FDAARGOS_1420]|nr:IS3 family transposase [Bacillus sp. FDAARGOS_1420]